MLVVMPLGYGAPEIVARFAWIGAFNVAGDLVGVLMDANLMSATRDVNIYLLFFDSPPNRASRVGGLSKKAHAGVKLQEAL